MPAPKDPEKYIKKRSPLSEATKAKISAANTGKKRSTETLAHLSEISRARWEAFTDEEKAEIIAKRSTSLIARYEQYGDWVSPEIRARVGAENKVRPPRKDSEETKAKRNASLRGKKQPPRTDEYRAKQSAAKRGKKLQPLSEEHKARLSEARKGRALPESTLQAAHTPEVKARRIAAFKKSWESLPPEEKARRTKRFVEAGRKSGKNQNTNIERFVAKQLDALQIVYERQKRIGLYSVDFFIPADNLIIEVNGCFWHGCEVCGFDEEMHLTKRAHDAKRLAYLESKGYTVGIVWQHDLEPYME